MHSHLSKMISHKLITRALHFKLIIAGGGTGGASTAHKFVNKLGNNQIALVEPSDTHYYQPLWTLVGAGIKPFEQSYIPMSEAVPKNVKWFKDRVEEFNPDRNSLKLQSGTELTYDFLVVALGIQIRYEMIPGAVEALKHDSRVVSNYSPNTVKKTYEAFKSFFGGNALFSFPNTPVKCAGAPQKVMYLFDDYLKKKNTRDNATIHYFTTLPTIFSVKKYSDKLTEMSKERKIKVTTRSHLIEVDHLKSMAKFENLDTKEIINSEYEFLHITPPMTAYEVLKSGNLSDETGFVAVNKETLQHAKYPNVFALGDCSNLPTSKTAAAIASQHNILFENLNSLMNGGPPNKMKYDGYTSCPFVTSFNKGILAEFGYDGKIMETFPINQANESYVVFLMKSHLLPSLYWNGLIRGRWNGPSSFRKLFHLNLRK